MRLLTAAGLRPGSTTHVEPAGDGVHVWSDGGRITVDRQLSDHVFVRIA
ncbi:MAG: hypothetical protein M3N95_07645 [Actinomycetota bacterium]|nr:hypothetical protein [Actinomycetota bacterium]